MKPWIANMHYQIGLSKNNKRKKFQIHRLVLQTFKKDFKNELQTDHIDRNPLNNRLDNLRQCTHSENHYNVLYKNKTGLKGVRKRKRPYPFYAQIKHLGKSIYLGQFKTAEEAAKAYDIAAREIAGEFALTNY